MPTIMCRGILTSTRCISGVGGSRGHILVMWKWVSQHNRLLCYEPRGFLNFGAQVGKVIIFTKFTRKLHLPLFFLSLTNIIIRFIIIIVILAFYYYYYYSHPYDYYHDLSSCSLWVVGYHLGSSTVQNAHLSDWVVEDEVIACPTVDWLRDKSFSWFVTWSIVLALVEPMMPST
jgi:hypothetical protein